MDSDDRHYRAIRALPNTRCTRRLPVRPWAAAGERWPLGALSGPPQPSADTLAPSITGVLNASWP